MSIGWKPSALQGPETKHLGVDGAAQNGAGGRAGDGSAQWRILEALRQKSEAKIRRLAQRVLDRAARIEEKRGGGMTPAARAVLAVVFVVLASIVDYALFDALLGFPPVWTWTVTVTANLIFLVIVHWTLPEPLYDLVHAEHMRGSAAWIVKAVFVTGTCLGMLAFTAAAAWIRAKGVSLDTGILGVLVPGFGPAVAVFFGLLFVFFGGAVLLGYKDVERAKQIASGDLKPQLSIRDARRVEALAEGGLQACHEMAGKANSKLLKVAVRQGDKAPRTLPQVGVPNDVVKAFTKILNRYKKDGGKDAVA